MRLALPKGRLLEDTATLLQEAGLELSEYHGGSRSYLPRSAAFPDLALKVFQEKDIPIQVAIGNYDLGICGLDWIEELMARYPHSDLAKVRDLGYGRSSLYAVASRYWGISSLGELNGCSETTRIVSEYQNLAESLALSLRLKRFSVLPVWGAAEVYPPESADLAVVAESAVPRLEEFELIPLARLLTSRAFLVANKRSLAQNDMSPLLSRIAGPPAAATEEPPSPPMAQQVCTAPRWEDGTVRLALPDGHQQRHAVDFLKRAGISVHGYGEAPQTRRPTIDLEGVAVKVIRPQDMPQQVANGNFDLAVTGRDWLTDHLCRFPQSPVQEVLDLGFGTVSIVAVVHRSLPASDPDGLRGLVRTGRLPAIRVASEYLHIADKYARDNHLERYRVIPTWGASEAFLPDDADLLIENTETGETLKRHNLEVIDTLFRSSGCLIGNAGALADPAKRDRTGYIIEAMERAA
ncbi:MAG: ATP phosphoribosyltransferase [Chloroflexota bacterium]|nr:ATP phosphoribosyltransferase [Chloroflexota bacterium]